MDIESLRIYCLSKDHTIECFPFNEVTLVFKTCNKMFALINLDSLPVKINLKCHPDWSLELREDYLDVIYPAFHMNKKHWNTVVVDEVPFKLLKEMIDHSYDLIVASLTKKMRLEYFPIVDH